MSVPYLPRTLTDLHPMSKTEKASASEAEQTQINRCYEKANSIFPSDTLNV